MVTRHNLIDLPVTGYGQIVRLVVIEIILYAFSMEHVFNFHILFYGFWFSFP